MSAQRGMVGVPLMHAESEYSSSESSRIRRKLPGIETTEEEMKREA